MAQKKQKLTVLEVFKDIFDWYPKEYPDEERK